MATREVKYPKLRMAIGAGDLIDVYDVSLSWEDGKKSVSTLRQPRSGHTVGSTEVKVTFKSYISEEGFERDYFGPYQRDEQINAKVKLPGGTTIGIVGTYTQPRITGNVDGAVEFEMSMIGSTPGLALAGL